MAAKRKGKHKNGKMKRYTTIVNGCSRRNAEEIFKKVLQSNECNTDGKKKHGK